MFFGGTHLFEMLLADDDVLALPQNNTLCSVVATLDPALVLNWDVTTFWHGAKVPRLLCLRQHAQ